MEPNKTYGWAGPVCYCPKDPAKQYQRPSNQPSPQQEPSVEEARPDEAHAIMVLSRAGKIPLDQVRFIWDHCKQHLRSQLLKAEAELKASEERAGRLERENNELRGVTR